MNIYCIYIFDQDLNGYACECHLYRYYIFHRLDSVLSSHTHAQAPHHHQRRPRPAARAPSRCGSMATLSPARRSSTVSLRNCSRMPRASRRSPTSAMASATTARFRRAGFNISTRNLTTYDNHYSFFLGKTRKFHYSGPVSALCVSLYIFFYLCPSSLCSICLLCFLHCPIYSIWFRHLSHSHPTV